MVYFVYHDNYFCDIGTHVFPMQKFRAIRDRLKDEAGVPAEQFLVPEAAGRAMLELVHTDDYLDDLENLRQTAAILASELPISAEIVQAYKLCAGGSALAFEKALDCGCAINLAGGFHHAFPDHGEGFCYIHDIAVAVRHIQATTDIKRFAVIDCDLHQGNGTAVIFQRQPEVFTFSIHQEYLYPKKEHSDLDIGLDLGTDDDTYLNHLRTELPRIVEEHKPQLIAYIAGADPFKEDQLGNLMLTKEGLSQRDRIIFSLAKDNDIPVAVGLAGGYARDVTDTVDIQFKMCLNAIEIFDHDGR
ncbi:histone deacetylase [Planctomycetota bacterium]